MADARMEAANKASLSLKKLHRADHFIFEERGSRDLHGTAYEFFRNSAMDANTWARNVAPLALLLDGKDRP